jgi:hypothetical protein
MFFSPSRPRMTLLIDPKKQQKKKLFMSSTEINIIDKDKKKRKEITISYRIDYEKRFLKNIRN